MDTIFVKNVKDGGPAHRAGLRTGESVTLCNTPLGLTSLLIGLEFMNPDAGEVPLLSLPFMHRLLWTLTCDPTPVPRRPASEGEWGERHWEDILPGHRSDPEQVSVWPACFQGSTQAPRLPSPSLGLATGSLSPDAGLLPLLDPLPVSAVMIPWSSPSCPRTRTSSSW